MIILSIETSCDDTGIAVIKAGPEGCRILSNIVSSQINIHRPYGGVVPNLAARAHLKNIGPCFKKALEKAKYPKIDLIAVTVGPGLIPSLLVGVNFAKALAYAQKKPIIGVNHIKGHIYANSLFSKVRPCWRPARSDLAELAKTDHEILCLVASGGHTQLILMENHGKYKLLGETRDDAAGEAFDKTAKLLGLGYPGGPILSQRAEEGDPQAFDLPRPMINANNFDFSFSGLKTAVLYEIKKEKKKMSKKYINDMSASFQQAAIDVLISKTIRAGEKYGTETITLSGGVAANKELRKQLKNAIEKNLPDADFRVPPPRLCADNAAMIAAAAFYKTKRLSEVQPCSKYNWRKIQADSNLRLIAG